MSQNCAIKSCSKNSEIFYSNLYFIMLKNGQTYFKNLAVLTVYKECLTIFQHYERKGETWSKLLQTFVKKLIIL